MLNNDVLRSLRYLLDVGDGTLEAFCQLADYPCLLYTSRRGNGRSRNRTDRAGGRKSMKLVIAEKPSVGAAIAAVLGANEKRSGYFEGSGYLVSWCIGHLISLADAATYNEQYRKWKRCV